MTVERAENGSQVVLIFWALREVLEDTSKARPAHYNLYRMDSLLPKIKHPASMLFVIMLLYREARNAINFQLTNFPILALLFFDRGLAELGVAFSPSLPESFCLNFLAVPLIYE